ncbi:hypothetical protein LTR56_008691 [Elasticomyces elasticus]|nr:hypothetical protein LTR22_018288 [Elasticomyces elasticus]KAK3646074.1 hypothetical protein LTR56_008691 [Elasticomyces elasticus]KAK4924255.1 hypothetical protein LTR49_008555 [Elasticomyces elasticus]KAK5743413.1 hypothetical protein LTS12_023855 [Elasticomyces elasticus]
MNNLGNQNPYAFQRNSFSEGYVPSVVVRAKRAFLDLDHHAFPRVKSPSRSQVPPDTFHGRYRSIRSWP